jgi:hypothetical protein
LSGVLEIDRVNLKQREIRSPSFGLRICPSTVSPVRKEKRRICEGDIDVVGPGQVIRIGRAEETRSRPADLDNAFADNVDIAVASA